MVSPCSPSIHCVIVIIHFTFAYAVYIKRKNKAAEIFERTQGRNFSLISDVVNV